MYTYSQYDNFLSLPFFSSIPPLYCIVTSNDTLTDIRWGPNKVHTSANSFNSPHSVRLSLNTLQQSYPKHCCVNVHHIKGLTRLQWEHTRHCSWKSLLRTAMWFRRIFSLQEWHVGQQARQMGFPSLWVRNCCTAPIELPHTPQLKQARWSVASPKRTMVSLGQKSSWHMAQYVTGVESAAESLETLVVELDESRFTVISCTSSSSSVSAISSSPVSSWAGNSCSGSAGSVKAPAGTDEGELQLTDAPRTLNDLLLRAWSAAERGLPMKQCRVLSRLMRVNSDDIRLWLVATQRPSVAARLTIGSLRLELCGEDLLCRLVSFSFSSAGETSRSVASLSTSQILCFKFSSSTRDMAGETSRCLVNGTVQRSMWNYAWTVHWPTSYMYIPDILNNLYIAEFPRFHRFRSVVIYKTQTYLTPPASLTCFSVGLQWGSLY